MRTFPYVQSINVISLFIVEDGGKFMLIWGRLVEDTLNKLSQ